MMIASICPIETNIKILQLLVITLYIESDSSKSLTRAGEGVLPDNRHHYVIFPC